MEKEDCNHLTINQFCEKYPWPTAAALRHIIMKTRTNGFGKAFIRVGKRVLVKEDIFWNIVDKLQKKE